MSSKFLTFLTILVLFLSALGSSAERIKRQASCSTYTIGFTTTDTSTPGCTYNLAMPTATAISCGTCDNSGSSAAAPALFLKRQDSSCKTVTTSVTSTFTTNACTMTIMAPTVTAVGCGTC
ncbi:hypothetical protein F8M41_011555 [Gigaspora margarita]|uniref:Uncharacterized protein n=1 Tax=Gigaspora margarita TaxID=4874 RepID=A0A8H3X0L9_GIGMA|nr:hypothetical protein F8M41_011555 [Gigaspora margarita]